MQVAIDIQATPTELARFITELREANDRREVIDTRGETVCPGGPGLVKLSPRGDR